MANYLKIRSDSNIPQFHIYVPKALQTILNKKNITQSLPNMSLEEAALEAAQRGAYWKKKFHELKKDPTAIASIVRDQRQSLSADDYQMLKDAVLIDLQFKNEDEFNNPDSIPADRLKQVEALERIMDGDAVMICEHKEQWLSTLTITQKRINQHDRSVSLLMEHHPDIKSISRKQAYAFINDVLIDEKEMSPSTVNDYISSFNLLTKWLINVGELPATHHNPWRGLSKKKVQEERVPVPDDVLGKMLKASASNPSVHNAIKAAALTGMRRGELTALNPSDIEQKDGYDFVHIRKGKTKSSVRTVAVKTGLVEWSAMEGHPDNITREARELLNRFTTDERISPMHSLRHRAATILEQADLQEYSIKRWLGHTPTAESFKTYSAGMSDEQIKKIANLLQAKLPAH